MASGSQLQVAKLAQMCPAVRAEWCRRLPHYAARCRIVSNSAEWCQMVLNGAERCQMVPNSAEWCQTMPNGAKQCQMVPNGANPKMEHLVAPNLFWSSSSFSPIFFTSFLKKRRVKAAVRIQICIRPSPRGPQEALGA